MTLMDAIIEEVTNNLNMASGGAGFAGIESV
jgi:hypothetical protein